MKGHYSIDYEYDYILWFRTNSALSNETYLIIKSQMQKCITTKKKGTSQYTEPLRKLCFIITSLFGRDFFMFGKYNDLKHKKSVNFIYGGFSVKGNTHRYVL